MFNKSFAPEISRLSAAEVIQIFESKCDDFGIQSSEKLLDRFKTKHCLKSFAKSFEMNCCSLGPSAVHVICNIVMQHPNMKKLSLNGNSMGDEGAEHIANLIYASSNLIYVDVSSNSICDKGMCAIFFALSRNNNIISISVGSSSGVSRNSFGNDSVKQLSFTLANNRVLYELDISMSEISFDSISVIALGLNTNRTLHVLNLASNNIRSKGCKVLLECIAESMIESLNISNNNIKDDTANDFRKYFVHTKSLKILNLSGNILTKLFIKGIGKTLGKLSTLEELNLSRNPLCGPGIEEFSTTIALSKTIKVLNISCCQIDSFGLAKFCSELLSNTSLSHLLMAHNPIGDNGAQSLVKVVREHPALKEIDLEYCEITDIGGDVLIPQFAMSPAIERISMKNNLIRNSRIIENAVSENQNLIYFNIEFNDLNYKSFNEINHIIQNNSRRWNEHKKERIQKAIAMTGDVENKLKAVRSDIIQFRVLIKNQLKEIEMKKVEVEQRRLESEDNFKMLEKQYESLCVECTTGSKEHSGLYDQYSQDRFNVNRSLSDLREKRDQESKTTSMYRKIIQGVESRIYDEHMKISRERMEISDRIVEVTQRYKDAYTLLDESFKIAHGFSQRGTSTDTKKQSSR